MLALVIPVLKFLISARRQQESNISETNRLGGRCNTKKMHPAQLRGRIIRLTSDEIQKCLAKLIFAI